MDTAPEITAGRTCLPVAMVAQVFGSTASWDAATRTITIK
ncbi:stalk domain-containing protein [Bacteroides sp.]|nr:stalk domain-containing protein [Syntrophomonadaceae bacterium]